jgi:hypothetical protein
VRDTSAEVWVHLGDVPEKLGDVEEAVEVLGPKWVADREPVVESFEGTELSPRRVHVGTWDDLDTGGEQHREDAT